MAVTLDDIATRLGVATPDSASPLGKQWLAWIGDAQFLIDEQATKAGVTPTDASVDRVVTLAVVEMARKPDNSTQVDVAVDDARVSRRYETSTGRVTILDEWWTWLGLAHESGAFNVSPGFEADGPTQEHIWWPV